MLATLLIIAMTTYPKSILFLHFFKLCEAGVGVWCPQQMAILWSMTQPTDGIVEANRSNFKNITLSNTNKN